MVHEEQKVILPECKDIYLSKDGQIIGIHAVGYFGEHEYDLLSIDGTLTKVSTDFDQMEIWGNEYDEEHNMIGRGSFRVHGTFNDVVAELEMDGWVKREPPDKGVV